MTVEKPSVSVIIVAYNSERWIRACIDALLAQVEAPAYELIVVDNGSTDMTRSILESEYPSVRVLHRPNRGFGAGNNVGASVSRGEYLAFLNPDTVASPTWLARLVEPLSAGGVVTTSKIVLFDNPAAINTCGNALHFTGYGFPNGYLDEATSFALPMEVPGISGAAFAMRATDFHQIGGFDEDYFLYMEDTDLSWRARRAGLRIELAPGSVVQHSYSLQLDASKIYYAEKGRAMLLRKHLRRTHWAFLFPSLLLAEFLAWAYALRLGRAGLAAKWRATQEGWTSPLRSSDLPPIRLRAFAMWRMPLSLFGRSVTMRVGGISLNALFWLNTLGWLPRRMSKDA